MVLKDILIKDVNYLLPKYTEITLFLTSLTVFLIMIIEFTMFREFFGSVLNNSDAIFIFSFPVIGFLLSIYYAFSDKKISFYAKGFMLTFVILANFIAGVSAGFHILEVERGFAIIFPFMNFISASVLLVLAHGGAINENSIMDIQAKRSEILVGSIAVIIIFFCSRHILNDYWAVTFSICLVYATNINNFMRKIIIIIRN